MKKILKSHLFQCCKPLNIGRKSGDYNEFVDLSLIQTLSARCEPDTTTSLSLEIDVKYDTNDSNVYSQKYNCEIVRTDINSSSVITNDTSILEPKYNCEILRTDINSGSFILSENNNHSSKQVSHTLEHITSVHEHKERVFENYYFIPISTRNLKSGDRSNAKKPKCKPRKHNITEHYVCCLEFNIRRPTINLLSIDNRKIMNLGSICYLKPYSKYQPLIIKTIKYMIGMKIYNFYYLQPTLETIDIVSPPKFIRFSKNAEQIHQSKTVLNNKTQCMKVKPKINLLESSIIRQICKPNQNKYKDVKPKYNEYQEFLARWKERKKRNLDKNIPSESCYSKLIRNKSSHTKIKNITEKISTFNMVKTHKHETRMSHTKTIMVLVNKCYSKILSHTLLTSLHLYQEIMSSKIYMLYCKFEDMMNGIKSDYSVSNYEQHILSKAKEYVKNIQKNEDKKSNIDKESSLETFFSQKIFSESTVMDVESEQAFSMSTNQSGDIKKK